jgi:hypothetical protein
MEFTVFVLLVIAGLMAHGIRKHTELSITKSIILGLTLCIPVAFSMIIDMLQFFAVLGLRLGCIAGGEDFNSLMAAYLTKQLKNAKVVEMGDGSKDEDIDDSKKH